MVVSARSKHPSGVRYSPSRKQTKCRQDVASRKRAIRHHVGHVQWQLAPSLGWTSEVLPTVDIKSRPSTRTSPPDTSPESAHDTVHQSTLDILTCYVGRPPSE